MFNSYTFAIKLAEKEFSKRKDVPAELKAQFIWSSVKNYFSRTQQDFVPSLLEAELRI